jgi:hypothetical protein
MRASPNGDHHGEEHCDRRDEPALFRPVDRRRGSVRYFAYEMFRDPEWPWSGHEWFRHRNGRCRYRNGTLGRLSYRNGRLGRRNGRLSYRNGTLGRRNGRLSCRNGTLGCRNGRLSYRNGRMGH